jgi:sulfatase modifying factor 1
MTAIKPEPRYDVFISYRRGAAGALAVLLQTHLQKQGVTAFLDRDLRRGVFDDMLLRRITEAPSFLIILTPHALDRCSEEEDWLRKEIIQAISSKRNIIPLQVDSFQFTSEVVWGLDPAIRDLSRYQAVVYSLDYLESTIERIVKIVEEDKAERQEIERAEAEKQEREKAEETKQRSASEALRVADQRRRQRQRAEAQEKEKIGTLKAETSGPEKRSARHRLSPRKLLVGSFVAITAIGMVMAGLRFFSPSVPSKPPGNSQPEHPIQPSPIEPKATPQPAMTPGGGANRPAGTTVTNPKDGLKYVWIPSGAFTMGCSSGECNDDEKPAHRVKIRGFWLGQTLVTQKAYQKVIGTNNPSYFRGEQFRVETAPVEHVTWNEAKAYCIAVGGRLPAEAEWEYAARGVKGRKYPWGNEEPDRERANYAATKINHPTPVGLFPSGRTPEGLDDLAGNLWEWVKDPYDKNYYKNSPSENPHGPASGQYHVVRGGSWDYESGALRSSFRNAFVPGDGNVDVGFRCAREVFP